MAKIAGILLAIMPGEVWKTQVVEFVSNITIDNLAVIALSMGAGFVVAKYIITRFFSHKREKRDPKHEPIIRQLEAENEKFNPDGSRSVIRFKYTEVFKTNGYFS